MMNRALIAACFGLATLATTAPAMAEPDSIKHCRTLSSPGAYVLERNLSATGNCLIVAASNVSINLGGFVITGNGSGAGISDGGVAQSGITVRNGGVAGFANGIDLRTSNALIIEGIRATGNGQVGIYAGYYSLVRGNVAVGNGGADPNGGGGIRISNSPVGSSSTVSDNTASGNPGNGIMVTTYSTVTGNTASENGNDGFDVVFGSTLSNNTAGHNGHDGFSIDCPSNMVGNTAQDNGSHNVHELGSAGTCVYSNNLLAP